MLQIAANFQKGFVIAKNYDHSKLNRYGMLQFITQAVRKLIFFKKLIAMQQKHKQ